MLGSDSSGLVVLLASVLKPVDDTRMRGKFAETLLSRPATHVHVAGRATGNGPEEQSSQICQHCIFRGSRLSLNRLAAQWRYWRLLHRLQPDLVIVHAPELLPLTMLWQLLGRGRRFLYDIRENYALNVSSQRVYQGLTRRGLAAGLRRVETWAARRAQGLILAEASYANELPFLHYQPTGRVVILENKYQPTPTEALPAGPQTLPTPDKPLRLLYTGTISELNGVWEAIALTEQLRTAWPGGARLTIVGFCQQPGLLQQLEDKAQQNAAWLTLIGGASLVPHARIVAEIGQSHVGLLPYRPHPSTERCRPTKLFEYLAHGLPVLSSPNPLWHELLHRYEAGLQLDFAQPINGPALVAELQRHTFYSQGIPTEVLWASEAGKLWHLLDSLV
ncbi:glycosyltransferase [Hymenobacter terrenus]|uniref:glycosyltransferase n=1 Tax=Hymenobacter terrenus TaxID=1629124 RepID=UPI0012E086A2|nr:glycosyltransferase [Hymenobacter terrenus]